VRASKLGSFDEDGLRRVLRGARIGLAMAPDTAQMAGRSRAGSDGQLTGKIAGVWAELRRRRLMEKNMDDEARDDREGGAAEGRCGYPGCGMKAKRDGLCFKHLTALIGGDEAAKQAVRDFYQRKRAAGPPLCIACGEVMDSFEQLKSHQAAGCGADGKRKGRKMRRVSGAEGRRMLEIVERHLAANGGQATSESEKGTSMIPRIPCEKCGREFDPRGIGPHRKKCPGPIEAVEPCGIDGCRRPKGHAGRHYRGRPAGKASPSASPRPMKRKYTRHAIPPGCEENTPSPAAMDQFQADRAPREHLASQIHNPQSEIRNQEPPDGISLVGHQFMRIAELLGLAAQLADFPHPDGHCFANIANGKAVVVTAAGESLPADLVVRK